MNTQDMRNLYDNLTEFCELLKESGCMIGECADYYVIPVKPEKLQELQQEFISKKLLAAVHAANVPPASQKDTPAQMTEIPTEAASWVSASLDQSFKEMFDAPFKNNQKEE